ncbi:CaiB/BaiF CoA transferase family protein [Vermiculatibacterium agrestimuris]|uniref:CaiB/BaiF CoA transferase family protein n=1 Tax=Vermiculatibacterium agrestimuris TaxID=2941519 RepID=UPI00203C43DE|nr:CoA transferase [Vermiculatibacterium agrestimuris]
MGPLEGIKVLDLSNFLAASTAGRIMAEWGADVIKIEPLSGDTYRNNGPYMNIPIYDRGQTGNPSYDNENGNKRWVALNLKSEKGMAVFRKLLATADVLITNYRPGALKKLGISYDDLKEEFPRLVFGSILGYGKKGPASGKPGFDYTAFYARSGLMADAAPRGGDLVNTVAGLGDHFAATALVAGINAALVRRSTTGKGDLVEASLFQAGCFALSSGFLSAYSGKPWPRTRFEPNNSTSNTYKCKDGEWFYLAATAYDKQWADVATKVLGRPDLATDPRFVTRKAVEEQGAMEEQVRIMDEIFATKTYAEWAKIMTEADIAFEKAQHFTELVEDPQALENEYIFYHAYPNGKKAPFAHAPAAIASCPWPEFQPAKLTGADTEAILKEMGYSDAEIKALMEDGDVAGPTITVKG